MRVYFVFLVAAGCGLLSQRVVLCVCEHRDYDRHARNYEEILLTGRRRDSPARSGKIQGRRGASQGQTVLRENLPA